MCNYKTLLIHAMKFLLADIFPGGNRPFGNNCGQPTYHHTAKSTNKILYLALYIKVYVPKT